MRQFGDLFSYILKFDDCFLLPLFKMNIDVPLFFMVCGLTIWVMISDKMISVISNTKDIYLVWKIQIDCFTLSHSVSFDLVSERQRTYQTERRHWCHSLLLTSFLPLGLYQGSDIFSEYLMKYRFLKFQKNIPLEKD